MRFFEIFDPASPLLARDFACDANVRRVRVTGLSKIGEQVGRWLARGARAGAGATRIAPLALLAGFLAAPPAQAAFPGANGKIAFQSTRDSDGEIYKMNATPGATQDRVTNVAQADFGAAWSPDGLRLAVMSQRADDRREIWTMDANGSATDRLTTNTADDDGPAWSPDGQKIAFRSDRDGNSEIYVMNANGSSPERRTNNSAFDDAPAWSPDGTKIAFASTRGGGDSEIYVMNADGTGTPDQLTDNSDADVSPVWSPDGTKIAFTSQRDLGNNLEIYVMNADGTLEQNRSNSPTIDQEPAWSPDGTKIAFVRNPDGPSVGDFEIYVMDADGSDQTRLTDNTAYDDAPDWQPLPGLVAISSGPPALFNQRNATVEFSFIGGSPPAGHFECRIDDFGFAECESPKTFTNIPDGEHSIAVRYKPDSSPAGPPAVRTFTVDGTAPTVTIDEAPSGADNPPDSTIRFHADDPAAAFVCTFEGQAPFECSSPVAAAGRPSGPNRFEVVAIDAAGNFSLPGVATWEVRDGAPVVPEFQCPINTEKKLSFGVIVAIARTGDACFARETLPDGTQAFVSRGNVAVNGMVLTPVNGTQIQVDEVLGGGRVRATGQVKLQVGNVPLGWTFRDGFTFDGLAQGGLAFINKNLAVIEGAMDLAGLPVTGNIAVELSADNGGQTKLTPRLTLPKATFQGLPGTSPEATGLTVEVPITASNDLGLTGGIRLKVGETRLFGRLKVKDLDLFYDHTTRQFDGSASIKLSEAPAGRAQPAFTVAVSLGPLDGIFGILRKVSFQVSSVNRPVAPGLFLQRFGGAMEKGSDGAGRELARFVSSAGISLGPRITIGSFEVEAASLDGNIALEVPTAAEPVNPPFTVTATGTLKVVDVPFHEAKVRYVPPSRVEMTGKLDHSVFGFGFVGEMLTDDVGVPLSWASEDGVNIEVHGRASFGPLGTPDPADAVFSTSGYAVCAGAAGDRIGFGARWDGPGFVDLAPVCDMGPYRATGRVAQAGGSFSAAIRKGTRLVLLSVRGEDAPPTVTVDGPSESIARTIPVSEKNTTHIVLRRPAAGRRTVTAQEGSSRIVGLDVADALPPLRLRARVFGKGRKRTLTWRAGPLPGQRLVFTERGEQTAQVVKTTGARRGRFTFTPDNAHGRKRTIDVTVTLAGLPRLTRTVARFTAAAPPKLRKVRRIRLTGRTLRWQPQRAAREYALMITTSDRVTTSRSTRHVRLKLPAGTPRGLLTVRMLALDAMGRVGPVQNVKLRVKRAAGP